MALDRRVPENNDTGRGVEKGRDQPDSEESVAILPSGQVHMETPEEEGRHPAPSGGEEGGTGGVVGGLPRDSLGRTLRNMGHVREAKGEVLVARTVPGRASVRDDLRKLSDALHNLTPG